MSLRQEGTRVRTHRLHGPVGLGSQPIGSFLDGRFVAGDTGEPFSSRKPEDSARRVLEELTRKQELEVSSGKYERYATDPLNGFNGSSDYEALMAELKPMIKVLYERKDGSEREFRQRFRGKLLEVVAHRHLSARLRSKGIIVISPDDTLGFFRSLNPGRELIMQDFQATIGGISVPDGIGVDENGVIQTLYEYAVMLERKSDRTQIGKYHDYIRLISLLSEARFSLVHPRQNTSRGVHDALLSVSKFELPFTIRQLFKLEAGMYHDGLFRLGLTAGPEDIEDRMRHQDTVRPYRLSFGRLDSRFGFYGLKSELKLLPRVWCKTSVSLI